MGTRIRHSVFETNSSSVHSLTLANASRGANYNQTIVPDENGVITIGEGEFGWEQEEYNDPISKASYALTDQRYEPQSLKMMREVITEHTGAREVIFTDISEGYVDHQSSGTSDPAFESKDTLKNYLFNSESSIRTDNDNY